MVRFGDRRLSAVAPLDVVRESVIHARVDLELAYPACDEAALDRGDQQPHQTRTAIGRIDQHVQQARASFAPRRSRDCERDEAGAVPRRSDHRVGVRGLPPHLAL